MPKAFRLCEKSNEVSSPRKRGNPNPANINWIPTFVGMTKPEVLVFTQSPSFGEKRASIVEQYWNFRWNEGDCIRLRYIPLFLPLCIDRNGDSSYIAS